MTMTGTSSRKVILCIFHMLNGDLESSVNARQRQCNISFLSNECKQLLHAIKKATNVKILEEGLAAMEES